MAANVYAEQVGIWHIIREGEALCGAATGEPVELDIIPKPLCWRCLEAEKELDRP